MNGRTWTINGVTYRTCPSCAGSGVYVMQHESGDPQLDTTRRCGQCAGDARLVVALDVLAILADERRGVALLAKAPKGSLNAMLLPSARRCYRHVKARAMAPVKLPTHHYTDPLFREAKRDCDAAIANWRGLNQVFDSIFGRAA